MGISGFFRHPLWWILLLGLALRIYALDAPILGEHAWRQADTASIAQHFGQEGFRLLYPQVYWSGTSQGYVESEFPLYPYLVALAEAAFGHRELCGRSLSVLFSLLSILFLFRLVRLLVDEKTAIWSAGWLAILPTYAFFGRTFMSEPLMLMASVAGLESFARWTRSGRRGAFFLSAFWIALAVLEKLPALYLGAPLLLFAWLRFGPRSLLTPSMWLYAVLVLTPVGLWYWHAHQLFLETGLSFGIWQYGTDKWGNWELVGSMDYWSRILANRLAHRHMTWPGAALFVIGLVLPRRRKHEWVFDAWLLGLLVYLVVVGTGNYVHNYYQLPLLLPASVYMGKVYARYLRRPSSGKPLAVILVAVLACVFVLAAANLRKLYAREDPARSPVYELANQLHTLFDSEGLMISLNGGNPTLLYLADRHGWTMEPAQLSDEVLRMRIEQGATLAAGTYKGHPSAEALVARLAASHEVLIRSSCCYALRLENPAAPERGDPPAAAADPQRERR